MLVTPCRAGMPQNWPPSFPSPLTLLLSMPVPLTPPPAYMMIGVNGSGLQMKPTPLIDLMRRAVGVLTSLPPAFPLSPHHRHPPTQLLTKFHRDRTSPSPLPTPFLPPPPRPLLLPPILDPQPPLPPPPCLSTPTLPHPEHRYHPPHLPLHFQRLLATLCLSLPHTSPPPLSPFSPSPCPPFP